MNNFIEGLAKLGTAFWEHGRAFLWACAVASLLVFALLYGGRYLAIPDAGDAFAKSGLWLLIAFVVFTTLAVARTLAAWPKRDVFFISDEEQSHWGHARQQSGEVFTSLNFWMAVTNVSDSSVHISKPKIVWPLRARWTEVVTAMLVTEDTNTFHSSREFVFRRAILTP